MMSSSAVMGMSSGVRARIDTRSWPRPDVYEWIAREGNLPETELLRVFNCGIGMIVIVPEESVSMAVVPAVSSVVTVSVPPLARCSAPRSRTPSAWPRRTSTN